MSKFTEASQAMTEREKKVKAVYTELEQGMDLIGAIAVEDKLQENVRETLVRLGRAGIKVNKRLLLQRGWPQWCYFIRFGS